jgi:hypothetical protein
VVAQLATSSVGDPEAGLSAEVEELVSIAAHTLVKPWEAVHMPAAGSGMAMLPCSTECRDAMMAWEGQNQACRSRPECVLGWQLVLLQAHLLYYVVVGQAHLVEAVGSPRSRHTQAEEWMAVKAVGTQLERMRFLLVVAA